MPLLRFASFVVLALWIGGLAVLGGVGAPAIFGVLESADPAGGRDLAGRVFGAAFGRFQYFAWGFAGALLALLATRAAIGPRPRRFKLRLWVVTGMLAASLVTSFVIAPRIDAIREATPGAIAAATDDDPVKAEFGRLHGASNALMGLTLVAGLWLLWAEVRDPA